MNKLSPIEIYDFLEILKVRFKKNLNRHSDLDWVNVKTKLLANETKIWSLNEMEKTGGEPDVVSFDVKTGEYIFYDCCSESPKNRRSFCYDHEALNARKENKPKNSAINNANEMGIEILSEENYRYLQTLGNFDNKTSSWIKTPESIRKLCGAIFADFRFGQIFIYHNGAESYYAGRAFRGMIRI